MHTLYRFYSKTGQLLYIGISNDPQGRFRQHSGDKTWWNQVASITLENYETHADLCAAEKHAIQVEHPIYNLTHNYPAPAAHTFSCPNCGIALGVQITDRPNMPESANELGMPKVEF